MGPRSHYYRLKMVYWDASYAFPPFCVVKSVRYGRQRGEFLRKSDPGIGRLEMRVNLVGIRIISATDLTGWTLYWETIRLVAGQNYVALPRTGSGLHLVKLTHGREMIVREIVFQ